VLPTALDFALHFAGLWPNTHWSRALTGALAGAGLVFFVLPGLAEIAERRRSRPRRPEEVSHGDARLDVRAAA
jgi:hypothetical protein